jgi:GNAT superfamily N-acetyltransferase
MGNTVFMEQGATRLGYRFIDVQPDDTLIRQVIQLGGRHKAQLGFMPDTAFTDRAARGTLLAAIEPDGTLAGYALYDLPRQHVRLIHLCVNPTLRRGGVARQLVKTLSRKHPARTGIQVKCRRDFSAHNLWPRLGFTPRGDVAGRNFDGLPLTVWWLDHGHPDLFSYDPSSSDRLIVALDMNTFLDLYGQPGRVGSDETLALRSDWLSDQVEIVATPQLAVELDALPNAADRANQRRHFETLPSLRAAASIIQNYEQELRKTVGPDALAADPSLDSDIKQVAAAAAGGCSIFATRDAALIRTLADQSQQLWGLHILRPSDIVTHIDELRRVAEYQPSRILGTGYTLAAAPSGSEGRLMHLLNRHSGERRSHWTHKLREAAADNATTRWIVEDPRGQVGAYVAWTMQGSTITVTIFRTAAGTLASTLALQVAFLLRQTARQRHARLIEVDDTHRSSPVERALTLDGFVNIEGLPTGTVLDECDTAPRVVQQAQSAHRRSWVQDVPPQLSRNAAADLEHRWWPAKILGAGIPTYIVPIRPTWASELFGFPASLFDRPDLLGLSREHVYYRSPRPQPVTVPARILWYVSGKGTERVGGLIGCSRVIEVCIDTPAKLHARFKHLGVWTLARIEQAAKEKRVSAYRFTDTEIFNQPISWESLQAMAGSKRMGTLQSPTQVDDGFFSAIYQSHREKFS